MLNPVLLYIAKELRQTGVSLRATSSDLSLGRALKHYPSGYLPPLFGHQQDILTSLETGIKRYNRALYFFLSSQPKRTAS